MICHEFKLWQLKLNQSTVCTTVTGTPTRRNLEKIKIKIAEALSNKCSLSIAQNTARARTPLERIVHEFYEFQNSSHQFKRGQELLCALLIQSTYHVKRYVNQCYN